LLSDILREQSVLHADETSYRVLESDTNLTYFWTFLSGKNEEHGIILYHHNQRRNGQVAKEVLCDFKGYL
ncbi:transposase, partial [Streptococcus danieliae]